MKHPAQLVPLIGICLCLLSGAARGGERFTLDPRHSKPVFAINHLGFSTQYGRFNSLRGSIELDRAAATGSIDITIEAASIDMGEEDWDKHMRSPDFFHVEDFPTIIFRSERLVFEGERPVAAEGRLALLGVLQPLVLKIERFRCGLEVSTKRRKCGADASASLRRSDFGMGKYLPFVADEVRLLIPVEAYLEDEPAR